MTSITPENIYNYFVIEEWDEDDKSDYDDGFSYFQKYDIIGGNDEDAGFDELHDKMFDEIRLNYEGFNNKRSCMWVEEVKRRAKWVRGETIYGDSREKHYTYPIWWSRNREDIGRPTWILEADGYVSFSFSNGYTMDETADTKWGNYIRPYCLYNNKNCNELKEIKNGKKIEPKIIKKKILIIEEDEEESDDEWEDPKDIYGRCSDCNEILVNGYWWSRPDRNLKFCNDCGGHILDEEEAEMEKEREKEMEEKKNKNI